MGAELLGTYTDGIWYIDLAPLSNQTLVLEYVVQVLGIKEEDDISLEETLLHHLREKTLLLIFDNCEHLLPAVAPLAEKILQNSPWVRILATSREPLGISSEMVWWIPSLSTPNLNEEIDLEKLLKYESVKLFVDRAVAADTKFKVTEENALSIAQICARLDGIPLAIELAAARVKVLSVPEIAERLDDRFRLLVGSRTALHRQQTLRALIDWSYELLSESERVLLRRLSIFSGGWSLQAAEDVCSGGSIRDVDVLELLSNLVEKSLVLADTRAGMKRYRFLETILQYSQERLEESGDATEYARKHADYYLKLAEDSYGALWGPKQGYWLERLELDYDNIRKALDWLSLNDVCNEQFLTMAGSLWRFWEIRGNINEGRSWLERALAKNQTAPEYQRANGLRGAGNLARQQGDYGPAKSMHEQSLALFRELDDKLGIARELDALGELAYLQGDYERSVDLHTESLAIRHEIQDKEGIAASLGHLGIIARDRGRYQYAVDLLQESLKISRELEDKLMTALSLTNLGRIAYTLCEYERARELFEEAVSLYRELNDRLGISNVLQNLGDVARDQGNFARALEMYQECIGLKKEIGDRRGIAYITASQGEVAFYQGNYARAMELTETGLSLFEKLGVIRGIAYSKGIQSFILIYQGELNRARALADEVLDLMIEINAPRTFAYSYEIFGLGAYARGEFKEARTFFQKALEVFQKIEDKRNIAQVWINLARTAYREGERQLAFKYLNDSIVLSREIGIRWTLSFALEIMGLLEREEGQYEQALNYFNESLKLSVEQENQQGIANCLGALAGLAVLVNEPERAACMFAASEKIRRSMGAKMGSNDKQEYEHYLEILKVQLDVLDLTSAWSEGSMRTIEQILEDLEIWSVKSKEEVRP